MVRTKRKKTRRPTRPYFFGFFFLGGMGMGIAAGFAAGFGVAVIFMVRWGQSSTSSLISHLCPFIFMPSFITTSESIAGCA